ncbi:kinase-like protein [Coniochaeta ligniaria NRRL 30616]|uniref:Kinase-like protein n=1 Tax=Coniochaeta ligniaria NRRL 30616 TaxID=1408157 RepID=A0A1J7JNK3_9PEZI|nr:kinase-like protein [Coniochaeta ligniaria NRRL 30616]
MIERFSVGAIIQGDSGRKFTVHKILADRRNPLLCVYQASAEGQDFVIKNILPGGFESRLDMQKRLSSCPNIRTVVDVVRDLELFIFRFMTGDLLHLTQKGLSYDTRRDILRSALTGLADLHALRIIHTDIKPNNILVDYEETPSGELNIQAVRLSDLEDAIQLPPGRSVAGLLGGNQLWRSPESWARAKQNTSSDIYSFAVVMIYVMEQNMVFLVDGVESGKPEAWFPILRKHLTLFGDTEGIVGLAKLVGEEDPFFQRIGDLCDDINNGEPYSTIRGWLHMDADLRDLISKMTNLDPKKRITAAEALEHPWFHKTTCTT